jgi:phosphonate transport system permease protein
VTPLQLLLSFFPPELSPHYLLALAGPVLETVALAFGAMFAAFLVSLPLGVIAALNVRGTRGLLAALGALRAVPDLTLAILCVVLFGVGPGAGLVALAIYYTAGVSKMFADLLRTAPQAPLRALRGAGASRLQTALFGLLPLKRADLLSYGAYEFECALRASVVVGAVGGGGLGGELQGSLAAMDFQRVATQILLLAVLAAIFDALAGRLRRHPRGLLAIAPVGLVALVVYLPPLMSLHHAADTFAQMWPPQIPPEGWAALPRRILETLWMAGAGAGGAVAAALVFGPAGARNLSPAWLAWPVRRLMELLRAVPEVVWGLILIATAGVGPAAGAWALGLHSAGCLARLFADSLENAPAAPQAAIASTGASRFGVFAYATAPLTFGPLAAHSLFRFEWNLRMATVLGVIGAGGVGQALYEAQQLMFYRQMLGYILVTVVLLLVFDRASEALRRRHGMLYVPA